jgi:branched-chain amino acid transport system substrate-binding protein
MRNGIMAGLLAAALGATPALAEQPVKVGVLVTLSGPAAVLGQQVRDGVALALKQREGRLGGRNAELVVVDDELKPDVAVSRAKRLVESDKVDFVIGPIFSNILGAIFRPVTQGGPILISPNAGSSVFAGKQCSPDFFVTSYENTQIHAVLGEYAQRKGYRRAFLLAPNYQAGKDAVAGFKSRFKGEILAEDYVPLNTVDFQADLARVADAKPDVIFTFMPGGLGVALVRQFHQSGLAEKIPFLSAFTVDESTLPAEKDAAIGLYGAMTWAPDMDNAANRKFVADYLNAYHAVPGSYAMQGYDALQLIDSALHKTGGSTADKAKLRAALHEADFASPRGKFRFNTNGYPIQDFYLVRAAKRPDGLYETEIVEKVFSDWGDEFAASCPLK